MLVTLGLIVGISVLTFATIYLTILWQINSYESYWRKEYEKATPANALVYAALGDSTGQGIGASKATNGYVGVLADKIANKTSRPVHVINLSVSGAKVTNITSYQLPKMSEFKPDVITVAIGANDLKNFDEAKFKEEFSAMLDRLPKGAIVADVPYFGSGRHKAREGNAAKASKIIEQLVQEKGHKFASLYKTTKGRDSWRIHSFDRFHPSNYGYAVWADAFWSAIEPTL